MDFQITGPDIAQNALRVLQNYVYYRITLTLTAELRVIQICDKFDDWPRGLESSKCVLTCTHEAILCA